MLFRSPLIRFEEKSLANNFPALRTLAIDKCFRPWKLGATAGYPEDETESSAMSHPGVTDLTLDLVLGANDLLEVAALFPSVTTCEVALCEAGARGGGEPETSLTNDGLNSIWTVWPALQNLSLRLPLETPNSMLELDQLLTGIRKHAFRLCMFELSWTISSSSVLTLWTPTPTPLGLPRVSSPLSSSGLDRDTLSALACPYKTMPGLCDLKQLQEFTLHVGHWNEETHAHIVTDVGGYFGLALVSNTDRKSVV